MATSPLFGWEEPDDTDLVKDGAAAIRTLGNAIDTSMGDLLGGTSGQVLSKNSNTNMDFTWVTPDDANAIQNAIVDAKGDLIAATAADTPARLAVGTNGQVLTADSTEATGLKWATPATSGFVGCGLYRSGTGTISNATATIIDWNSERFDTNGFHDTVTNNTRITIPTGYAGKYLITWQWGFNLNTNGYRQVQILLNGSQLPQSYNLVTFNGYSTQSAALVYPLSVGDYLQLEVVQNSGGSLDSAATQDFFNVVYLGA